MKAISSPSSGLLIIGLPFIVFLSAVILACSPKIILYPELAAAITYDLTLTAPFVYFLLIRKRNIPKITVAPVFILGILLAEVLIPEHQKYHLNLVTTFLLPVVEISVVSIILFKVGAAVRKFKADPRGSYDFYATLKQTSVDITGQPWVGKILATEIAMIYYAFFAWKGRKIKEYEFSGFKKNGTVALFIAINAILLLETLALHIFIAQWSNILAWILTIASVYLVMQITGHLKAITRRYTEIREDHLLLKYGLFADLKIRFDDIESITSIANQADISGRKTRHMALLKEFEKPNVAIFFKKELRMEMAYGITKNCDTVLFQVDEVQKFIQMVSAKKDQHGAQSGQP